MHRVSKTHIAKISLENIKVLISLETSSRYYEPLSPVKNSNSSEKDDCSMGKTKWSEKEILLGKMRAFSPCWCWIQTSASFLHLCKQQGAPENAPAQQGGLRQQSPGKLHACPRCQGWSLNNHISWRKVYLEAVCRSVSSWGKAAGLGSEIREELQRILMQQRWIVLQMLAPRLLKSSLSAAANT